MWPSGALLVGVVTAAANAPATSSFGTVCNGSSASLNAADCSAWHDLYDLNVGAWNADGCHYMEHDPCSIILPGGEGVFCTNGHITTIALGGYCEMASGPLPVSLSMMTKLQILSLMGNLTGTLPAWLLELTDLTELGLAHNQSTGAIPASLSELRNLTVLELYKSTLSGVIPPLPFAQYWYKYLVTNFVGYDLYYTIE